MCEDDRKQEKVCGQDTAVPTVDNTAQPCCHLHSAKCVIFEENISSMSIMAGDTSDVVIKKLITKLNNLQTQLTILKTKVDTNHP